MDERIFLGPRLTAGDRAMSPDKRKEVTGDQRQALTDFIEANPRLSTQLPTVLPSGFKLTAYNAVCDGCNEDVPAHSSWLKRDRQTFGTNVVEIWELRAICPACRVLTSCYMRFRADGSYDTLVGSEWRSGTLSKDDRRNRASFSYWFRRFLRWALGL